MTKEELKFKKDEIVNQLLHITGIAKNLNEQKGVLIDKLINLEPDAKLWKLN